MDRKSVLQFLKSKRNLFESRYQVEKIGLFGSYALEMQSISSDIDILVSMPSDFDRFYELKEYLESNLNCSVDLGLESSLKEFVRKRIQKEIIYV